MPCADSPGDVLLLGEAEARVGLVELRGEEVRDGVDAARREEDELRVLPAAELEARVGAEQVRLDEVVERAVRAREHRRLGGAFDDGVDVSGGGQVVAVAHVAVDERHARLAEAGKVELGSAAV